MNIIKEHLGATPYENFFLGGRRKSSHSNEVFATRKDKRIFDSHFLEPRDKKRTHEGARRAKSSRD